MVILNQSQKKEVLIVLKLPYFPKNTKTGTQNNCTDNKKDCYCIATVTVDSMVSQMYFKSEDTLLIPTRNCLSLWKVKYRIDLNASKAAVSWSVNE